jgi:hypothetical protein
MDKLTKMTSWYQMLLRNFEADLVVEAVVVMHASVNIVAAEVAIGVVIAAVPELY